MATNPEGHSINTLLRYLLNIPVPNENRAPYDEAALQAAVHLANRSHKALHGYGVTSDDVRAAWPNRRGTTDPLAAIEAAASAIEDTRDRFDLSQLTQLAEAANRISSRVRAIIAATNAPADDLDTDGPACPSGLRHGPMIMIDKLWCCQSCTEQVDPRE